MFSHSELKQLIPQPKYTHIYTYLLNLIYEINSKVMRVSISFCKCAIRFSRISHIKLTKLFDKTSHVIAFYIQLVANPYKQYCMQLYEACYKLIRFPPGIALCCCRWRWRRMAWICLALPAPRQTWPSGGPHYRRTRCGSLCRTSSRSGSSEQQSGNGSGSSPVYQKWWFIDISAVRACIY